MGVGGAGGRELSDVVPGGGEVGFATGGFRFAQPPTRATAITTANRTGRVSIIISAQTLLTIPTGTLNL
jgi:hypothetical protein